MSFFITDAIAAAGQAQAAPEPPGGFGVLAMPLMFLLIFYFLLWRPQSKRAKEQKEMLGSLQKGDEIVTSGGMLGKVVEIHEKFLSVSIAEGIVIKMQRAAVNTVLPKGTLKSV